MALCPTKPTLKKPFPNIKPFPIPRAHRYQKKKNIINKINTELKLKEQNIRNINNDISKIKKDILNVDNKKEDKVDKSKYELKLVGLNNAIKIREEWSESVDYWYNIFSPKSLLRSAIIRKYIAILSDIFDVVDPDVQGIFLCSDGLTNMMTKDQIEKVLIDKTLSIEEKVEKLILKSNLRGGTDNISIAYLTKESGETL